MRIGGGTDPDPGPRVTLVEPPRWRFGEHMLEVRQRGADTELGQISFRNLDRRRSRAELGIELYPAHRGRGYGTEAIRLLLRMLFDEYGLKTVYLRVREHNLVARRVYEKVGFRYVKTIRWPLVGIVRYLMMEIEADDFTWRPGPR